MTKYIVATHSITYKYVQADSSEEAKEIALCERVKELEEYVEVEEDEEDWVLLWNVNLLIFLINKSV